MQMLLYCVYIKMRSEAASLALGLLLKPRLASVFFGERSHYLQYQLVWSVSHLSNFAVDGLAGIQRNLLIFSDFNIMHIAVTGLCLMGTSSRYLSA